MTGRSTLPPPPPLSCVHSSAQSTYIYRAPQCMSPRWNWDSPTPFAASECALPPDQRVGGGGKGVGESQFQRLEKRLALCLLSAPQSVVSPQYKAAALQLPYAHLPSPFSGTPASSQYLDTLLRYWLGLSLVPLSCPIRSFAAVASSMGPPVHAVQCTLYSVQSVMAGGKDYPSQYKSHMSGYSLSSSKATWTVSCSDF